MKHSFKKESDVSQNKPDGHNNILNVKKPHCIKDGWGVSYLKCQNKPDGHNNILNVKKPHCIRRKKNRDSAGIEPGPFTCKAKALPLSHIGR